MDNVRQTYLVGSTLVLVMLAGTSGAYAQGQPLVPQPAASAHGELSAPHTQMTIRHNVGAALGQRVRRGVMNKRYAGTRPNCAYAGGGACAGDDFLGDVMTAGAVLGGITVVTVLTAALISASPSSPKSKSSTSKKNKPMLRPPYSLAPTLGVTAQAANVGLSMTF